MNPFSFAGHRPAQRMDATAEQRQVAESVVRTAASLVMSEESADAVLEHQCEALTRLAPRIVLAWTWFGAADTPAIRPQVVSGAAAAYARSLVIRRTRLTDLGPAFRTLAGHRSEPYRVSTLSPFGPWRQAAIHHGVRSVLALPLASTVNDQRGLFVLYADADDYFDRVGVGLFEALSHLFSAVLSRAERNAELSRAANRDPLTGLPNRTAIDLLQAGVRRVTERDAPCATLIIDLDHFKRINDTHGHAGGDAALCGVGRQLKATLRHGDTVARWGGEEFVVCLPATGPELALRVAEKLRTGLEAARFRLPGGQTLALTASIGVAMLRVDETLGTAIARADVALYAAKQGGRNRVEMAAAAAD